jgi:hypothetical protein
MSVSAFAQSHESLFPLLVTISGWDADSPEGMDMSSSGMKAITAAKNYSQGNKSFSASIIVGLMAQGMWNPAYQEGFMLETTEVSLKVERIKGFFVLHSFEKDKSGGAIIVLINEPSAEGSSDGAIFAVSFENMDAGEGLKIAQKFDWNDMKSQVSKL